MKNYQLKPQVLIVSNMYPDESNPSYGVFVRNIVNELRKFFPSVRLVTKGRSNKVLDKLKDYIKFYASSVKEVASGKYDIIYIHYLTHSFPPVIFGKVMILLRRKKGGKVVIHVHGSDLLPEATFTDFILNIQKPFLKLVDAWVVPSTYYKKVLTDFLPNLNSPILIYPSGGVNTELFKPMEKNKAKSELGLSKEDFVAGWVSRIDRGKGWEIYLEAANIVKKDIPNLKLLVVGSGREKELFLRKMKKLNLEKNVVMLGQLPQNKLPIIYNAMDVFIFPTVRKAESLGLVGLEALACGIPVIASKIGGISDYLIDGKNGFFFETGNPLDLAEKLVVFFKLSHENKEEFQKNARATALKFDAEKVSEELIKFFRNLTKSESSTGV